MEIYNFFFIAYDRHIEAIDFLPKQLLKVVGKFSKWTTGRLASQSRINLHQSTFTMINYNQRNNQRPMSSGNHSSAA